MIPSSITVFYPSHTSFKYLFLTKTTIIYQHLFFNKIIEWLNYLTYSHVVHFSVICWILHLYLNLNIHLIMKHQQNTLLCIYLLLLPVIDNLRYLQTVLYPIHFVDEIYNIKKIKIFFISLRTSYKIYLCRRKFAQASFTACNCRKAAPTIIVWTLFLFRINFPEYAKFKSVSNALK